MWNGAAATLNPSPTSSSAKPTKQHAVVQQHDLGEELRDPREVRRAGRAVDERDAVEEHRRRERAEQEVLEAGLLRREAPAVERGQHVQRDREDLERQEDRDEVVRRRHQHHAGGRAQHQREVLGTLEVLAAQVARPTATARAASRRGSTDCTNTAKPSTATSQCRSSAWYGPLPCDEAPLHAGEHRRGRDTRDRDEHRRRATRASWRRRPSAGSRSRSRRRTARSPARSRTSRPACARWA